MLDSKGDIPGTTPLLWTYKKDAEGFMKRPTIDDFSFKYAARVVALLSLRRSYWNHAPHQWNFIVLV